MKKILLFLVIVVLAVALPVMVLSSCVDRAAQIVPKEQNNNSDIDVTDNAEKTIVEHVHTYSTVYSFDDDYHWRAALCEHHDTEIKLEHSFDKDGACTICGFEISFVIEQVPGKDEYAVVDFKSEDGKDVVIPATYQGLPVTTINDMAFYEMENIETVVMPDSITTLNGNAIFKGCTSLKSVTLSASVEDIPDGLFSGLSALETVIIPDGSALKTIGASAFQYCSSLVAITIPGGVESIGAYAFAGGYNDVTRAYDDMSLTNVVFEDDSALKSIGDFAFYYCNSLGGITLPDSLESIGKGAFQQCSSLADITVPTGVESIGSNAFSGCSALESIEIPFVGATKDGTTNNHFGYIFGANTYSNNSSNVPSCLATVIITGGSKIADYSFFGCGTIVSVKVPGEVKSIGENAFKNASALESVTFEENSELMSIGNYAFSGCGSLGSIAIPGGVESIGKEAFYYCNSLETVTFEEDSELKSIGSSAFKNCSSLDGFTFPIGLESIGNGAFYNCSSLTSITIPSGVNSIGYEVFYSCTELASLTFEDDSNWYKVYRFDKNANENWQNKENGTAIDASVFSKASTNASNFTSESGYYNSFWYKKSK